MNNNIFYLAADRNGFKGARLDDLLAAGYYRMQHLVFTCNEVAIDMSESAIPVFWLRTLVKKCHLDKKSHGILKKCKNFSISIEKAKADDETEALYNVYKKHVSFTVSPSCKDYLHQQFYPDPFDSMMIKVRDNEKLVAVGFFDKGKNSIAGIMNMYDPAYKTYSLGKFLILQKLMYALSENIDYYYTGYISPGSTRFDYKIFPDVKAVEVLLPDVQEWMSYPPEGKAFLFDYYQKFLALPLNVKSEI